MKYLKLLLADLDSSTLKSLDKLIKQASAAGGVINTQDHRIELQGDTVLMCRQKSAHISEE